MAFWSKTAFSENLPVILGHQFCADVQMRKCKTHFPYCHVVWFSLLLPCPGSLCRIHHKFQWVQEKQDFVCLLSTWVHCKYWRVYMQFSPISISVLRFNDKIFFDVCITCQQFPKSLQECFFWNIWWHCMFWIFIQHLPWGQSWTVNWSVYLCSSNIIAK